MAIRAQVPHRRAGTQPTPRRPHKRARPVWVSAHLRLDAVIFFMADERGGLGPLP